MLLTIPILYGVVAAAVAVRGGCDRDNCLRAIVASAFPTRPGAADCSSYFMTTVIPATPTITIIPSSIPTYASACSGSVRYSSACSCIGVTGVTTTVVPQVTATQYINEDCTGELEQDTLTIGACIGIPIASTVNLGTFVPGSCTVAECQVDFYGTLDCSGGIEGTSSVISLQCINVDDFFGMKLLCPTCP